MEHIPTDITLQNKAPIKIPIKNFKTNEVCDIISLDKNYSVTNQDIEDVTEICNQETIYDFLFREKLKGERYATSGALSFFKYARDGWDNNSHFVFIIRNSKGRIIGAIDIKSNNLEDSEIGYWLSEKESGIMTNAVLAICDLARESGYKSLSALTKPDNENSQNVLKRSGFIFNGQVRKKEKDYYKFSLKLI